MCVFFVFYACLDHPQRVFGGLCECAKFGCNPCSNFDSMQILIFCTLSLKMPIHTPKIGAFGGFYPQNGEQYERDPQRAHPWAETGRMTYRSSKPVHLCGLGARRRIKPKIFLKVYLRNHNMCFFHVFAQTTHVVAAPHGYTCVGIPATWLTCFVFSSAMNDIIAQNCLIDRPFCGISVYVNEYVCASVSPLGYLRNHTRVKPFCIVRVRALSLAFLDGFATKLA